MFGNVFSSRRVLFLCTASAAFGLGGAISPANAQVATYQFNNSLNADQSGVAALNAVNPSGLNGFQTDTVLGNTRQVYRFAANTTNPSDQGGFTLSRAGLVASNTYSVETLFRFDAVNGYRRILDTLSRQSDSGFYVINSQLQDFPQSASALNGFTANTYHDVILTVSGAASNNVSAYLDGTPYFTVTSSDLNVDSSNLFSFFLDNVAGGGQGEYSNGDIALLRLYNTALTSGQATAISANPFASLASPVPEPGSVALLIGMAITGTGLLARRKRAAANA